MRENILPEFRGYLVDMKHQEFRFLEKPGLYVSIPFASQEGRELLHEMLSFAFEIIGANGLKQYLSADKNNVFFPFDSMDAQLIQMESETRKAIKELKAVIHKMVLLRHRVLDVRNASYHIQKKLGYYREVKK